MHGLKLSLSILFSAITAEVIPPVNFPAAGQNYSLMCTVSGADSLYPTINHYQWVHTRSQVGTNSPTLTFDPLVLSDAGQYSCEVTISSSLLSRNITIVSKHYRLRFISKFIQVYHTPLHALSYFSKCIIHLCMHKLFQ